MNFNIYEEFIKDDLPFIWSRLVYPKINCDLTVYSTVFFFSISIYLYFTNSKILLFYSFVIYITFLIVLAKVKKPFKQIVPDYRISDFAFDLLELRFSDYLKKYNDWNRKEVWMITKKIIGKYIFVEKEKITMNARFIEDLELDAD